MTKTRTKTRLLCGAAAILALGIGTASAQQPSPQPAPGVQQNAPAEKAAPPMNAGQHGPAARPETTGQAPSSRKPGSQESTRIDRSKGEMNGSGATDAHANGVKPAPSTTGQGAAGAHASLTTEQRSKIATVIKQHKVEPVHLNVDVRVGTRIPQSVRYHPLPAEVVTIYPEWRGFDYILVGDTIVVIDPGTREIVAVLDA